MFLISLSSKERKFYFGNLNAMHPGTPRNYAGGVAAPPA